MIAVDLGVDGHGGRSSLDGLRIAVLGTGQYGSAFAERLGRNNAGISVVLGSRRELIDPNGFPLPCSVLSYEQAAEESDVIVFAFKVDDHADVVASLGNRLEGKVIVDVSNSAHRSYLQRIRERLSRTQNIDQSAGGSNTIRLHRLLEKELVHADVVKAFNNISAYSLSLPSRSPGASRNACMISGDSDDAKQLVARIARTMGFEVVHMGGLDASAGQEGAVHSFFEGWKIACGIGFALTVAFLLYVTIAYWAISSLEWITYPTRSFLIVTGDVSAGLLAMTFLPGPIAAFWQLFRGTATRPFPAWFGTWLTIRKQLGLLSFAISIPHVIMACKGDEPTELRISSQLAPVFGTVAFLLFFVMSSCSRGTASAHFTWSEFRFIFVHIGYGVVGFTLAHVVCIGVGHVEDFHSSADSTSPFSGETALSAMFLVGVLGLSILLKLIVSVPPMRTWVGRIRSHQKLDLFPVWLRLSTSPSDADVNASLDPDRTVPVSQDSVPED
ncbi:hypothetical protein NDN08_005928 [Rhodosorus marinus]|uniref:Pyrroline-5-carboxylate reductase catalytic N-terminal domain-containing protein n=1 Tax=Rhodosorus marinus TaxID=101924 RepID=A0AAV8UM47_9RHOD|nr:hypothetical protein NDN08_005928 [Rhodosorus marinus]